MQNAAHAKITQMAADNQKAMNEQQKVFFINELAF